MFLPILLRFACKGMTAAFVLELLLCCESVRAVHASLPASCDGCHGCGGVSAEELFGAQGLLTLECCSL